VRPAERRQAIWEVLCQRRHETAQNLASEFGVSVRTVWYDIEALSLSYPIETVCGRYGGGVKVADWYHPRKITLSQEQQAILTQLLDKADEPQRRVLLEVLTVFGSPATRTRPATLSVC